MSKKVTVYNVKTGDPVEVSGVDAREYCKLGGWSVDPPAGKKTTQKTGKGQSKKVDEKEVDKEVIKKTAKK